MIEMDQDASAGPPSLQDATLTLSATDVHLVRTALRLLQNTYTRHDGMHPQIHAILSRLPDGGEE